jgi:hypothetical protein
VYENKTYYYCKVNGTDILKNFLKNNENIINMNGEFWTTKNFSIDTKFIPINNEKKDTEEKEDSSQINQDIPCNNLYPDRILYNAPNLKMKELITSGINNPYIQNLLQTDSLLGEISAPIYDPRYLSQFIFVNPSYISHRIISFKWDGMILRGDIELLNNELGNRMIPYMEIEDGCWFEPRTLSGTTIMLGKTEPSFQLITFDFIGGKIKERDR